MESRTAQIRGTAPLLMHSPAGLDPTNPLVIESRKITDKGRKKRTVADEARLLEIDFLLALAQYYNADGPFIPETCLLGTIRDGARRERAGKEILAGVMIDPAEARLEYKGPRDAEGLFASVAHRDVRPVAVGRARVVRCRPRFNEWSVSFSALFDPSTINEKTVRDALEAAGQYCGLMDFRPRFGRFEVVSWK